MSSPSAFMEDVRAPADLASFLRTFQVLEEEEEGTCDLEFLDPRPLLKEKVMEYLNWDRNPITQSAILKMVNGCDVDGLSEALESRLQFGTAGLRGKMDAGYNAMNDIVIIQTTQGFLKYLETVFSKEDLNNRGIVIGYDGRHNSSRFSILTANAFWQKGYQVYLFSKMGPTPWVPFAVTLFKCCAGIMITASHNPKEDNGYKVYWENGAQIISPHDKGIQKCILENLEPWDGAWEISPSETVAKIKDPLPEVMRAYYDIAIRGGIGFDSKRNSSSSLKFAYSAMHGVGFDPMFIAFKLANFPINNFVPVPEQARPDPEFPTVKFPNPEEGKSALNLAMQTAKKYECQIILANDPDADRLAVAEQLPNGEWKIFNGNEIGALLGWWCFYNYRLKYGDGSMKDCYMISSTVSSKILKTIGDKEGFSFRETLTGFKWMANLAEELERANKTVLFAFEEAIGFMVGTAVLDKDGISAGIRTAEMATHLYESKMTLVEKLNEIYSTYGYHLSRNSYYLCYNPETISNLFKDLREKKNGSHPDNILNGKYKVSRVRDLTTGYDSAEPDFQATLPVSKGSQMITFYFENGLVATLRTSGTEPKIKYYTELCASPEEKDFNGVKATLDEMVEGIINEWIVPAKWALELPPVGDDGRGDHEDPQ